MEKKYNDEFEQRKELKKVYMNLNIEFSELYMKHKSLLKAATETDRPIIHGEVSDVKSTRRQIVHGEASGGESSGGEALGVPLMDNVTTVEGAKGSNEIFTDAEIKFLQYMPLDKKSDCTFILQCLKYGYKNDITVLATRTLHGTAVRTEITSEGAKIHHKGKSPLSPDKVNRIKGLFMDRISKCDIHSAEYMDRMRDPYVNKLIAAGISNLSKTN